MIKREEACCVPELCTLRRVGLMNLCEAQSEPRHYATNFSIIVLFVNQCLFIMDAITVAAWFLFFPPLVDLIITHYSFFRFPGSQLTSTAFRESLNGLTKQRTSAYALPAICRQDLSFPPKQRRALFKCAHTHTRTHTSFRSCPSYDLPNLNLNSDLKGAVCRI